MSIERLPVRYREIHTGQPLISVTQVLTLAGRIDARWFTEESRWRGTMVHHLTEQLDRSEPMDEIPQALEPYMDAYWLFKQVCRPVYSEIELELQDSAMGLGGRLDRIVVSLFGDVAPGILDIKTGPPEEWHGRQLAAYNRMLPTGDRWGLYLKKNGSYRLKQYTDPEDDRRFMFDLAATQGRVEASGDFWVAAA